jgi:hemerythrin-like domain-containing protein
MKRNKNLVPFSWEHHDGLVVARRLILGCEKDTPVAILSSYVKPFWTDHLNGHFEKEESYIIPFCNQSNPLIIQLLKEHKNIRKIIKKIFSKKVELIDIKEFAEKLTLHIRFEERELFPWLERVLSPSVLEDIGAQLRDNFVPMDKNTKGNFWD